MRVVAVRSVLDLYKTIVSRQDDDEALGHRWEEVPRFPSFDARTYHRESDWTVWTWDWLSLDDRGKRRRHSQTPSMAVYFAVQVCAISHSEVVAVEEMAAKPVDGAPSKFCDGL